MAFGKGRHVDTDGFRGVAQPGSSKLDVPLSGTEVFRLSSEAHASLRVFLCCREMLHEFWGRAALRLQSIGHHQPSSSLSARSALIASH